MKRTKKLVSLLLTLVMVLAMTLTAFAGQEGTLDGGSITINDAIKEQNYKIYQILYLESYNAASGAYTYKANSEWEDFLKAQNSYVQIDDQGYVTWVENADPVEFAKRAQKYATEHSIDPVAETIAVSKKVSFEDLKLGYYLLDSTLGTLCSLDTTNPDVIIKEKNDVPTNEKEVLENSNNTYSDSNDANIGDTVWFRSTIIAQPGAENYVFHDKMSDGLTFDGEKSVSIKAIYASSGDEVDVKNNADIITAGLDDDCTFHITFQQAFCDKLNKGDKLVISYSATVNENAVIGAEGNANESKLSYGDDSNTKTTPPDETKTYTWDFDVFKYTKDSSGETALADAKFTLSKKDDGTDPIALVSKGDNIYRVAKTGDTDTITEITTDATGKFTIEGLDSGTYYLTETKAPAGYNKLSGPVTVTINNEGKVNVTTNEPNGVDEVKVENRSGNLLPSTGGMGTTIFYVVGSVLVLGAAVLLIVRRRGNASDR